MLYVGNQHADQHVCADDNENTNKSNYNFLDDRSNTGGERDKF